MAEGRLEWTDRAAWNHTAAILAMLYNANRGKGRPKRKPQQFNPWSKRPAGPRRKPKPAKVDVSALKVFLPPGSRER